MSPPIDIDGSEIQRATIDGEDVSEITIDGQQTAGFVDIPDSVVHRYDATKISGSGGDTISSWTDQEGSDNLTESDSSDSPTLKTNAIGGLQVLSFDGVDDTLSTSYSTLSEPYQFFIVYRYRTANSNEFEDLMDGRTVNEHRFNHDNDNNRRLIQGGTNQTGTNYDDNAHVATITWRPSGSDDELRIDGSQEISGDAGTSDSTGLTVAAAGDNTLYADVDIGEIYVVKTELSTSDRNGVESNLGDKWGVTI